MATAKKATMENAKIKMMVWGEPFSGKSRFALSAPKPLVIDLENSTGLYSNDFDFYRASINLCDKDTKNAVNLTKTIIDEIIAGEYKDEVETIIIDPVTDLLDNLETLLANTYEKNIAKRRIIDMNQLDKSKWYSYRRDKIREMLDMILNLDLNVVFVARAKNLWGKTEKGIAPIGKTFDGIDIIEYLPDVVLNFHTGGSCTVKKARGVKDINKITEVEDWNSIVDYIKKPKKSKIAKLNKLETA